MIARPRTLRHATRRARGRVVVRRSLPVLLAAAACVAPPAAAAVRYPRHTKVTATVFWIGEPVGNGSSENNALSAWDDAWQAHYGGFDDWTYRRSAPYFPRFKPHENPFYLDLPYNDFNEDGTPRAGRELVVPWAGRYAQELAADRPFSLLKNRWVKLWRRVGGRTVTCYGQIEDSGPYVYDDAAYVFGANDPRPRSRRANNAGIDVSPALRDCLSFEGLNDDENTVGWQFVEASQVPRGPWRLVITTRQVFWH